MKDQKKLENMGFQSQHFRDRFAANDYGQDDFSITHKNKPTGVFAEYGKSSAPKEQEVHETSKVK